TRPPKGSGWPSAAGARHGPKLARQIGTPNRHRAKHHVPALPGKSGVNLVNAAPSAADHRVNAARAGMPGPDTGPGGVHVHDVAARNAWTRRVRLGRVWQERACRCAALPYPIPIRYLRSAREIRVAQMSDTERASILAELTPPYTLIRPPEQLAPVVLCSPHS